MTSLTVIDEKDTRVTVIAASSLTLLQSAEEMTIDSNDMYEMAAEFLSDVHARTKELEALKDTVVKPMNAALKAVRAIFTRPEEKLEIAKNTIKRKMANWQNKLKIERDAEERRVAREAEAERNAAAATLAQVEEQFADGTASVDALEEAHAQVEIAQVSTPVARTIEAPKTSAGTGVEFVVTLPQTNADTAALLEWIAADLRKEVPRFTNTISFKVSELKSFAKATKGTVAIPGCNIHEDTKIIAR